VGLHCPSVGRSFLQARYRLLQERNVRGRALFQFLKCAVIRREGSKLRAIEFEIGGISSGWEGSGFVHGFLLWRRQGSSTVRESPSHEEK